MPRNQMPAERLLDRLCFFARLGSYPETHPEMERLYVELLRRCEVREAVRQVSAEFRSILGQGHDAESVLNCECAACLTAGAEHQGGGGR